MIMTQATVSQTQVKQRFQVIGEQLSSACLRHEGSRRAGKEWLPLSVP